MLEGQNRQVRHAGGRKARGGNKRAANESIEGQKNQRESRKKGKLREKRERQVKVR